MSEPRCACRGVDFGSYANSVRLPDPPTEFGFTRLPISVDACIAAEIQSLWDLGIKTTASCCGHGEIHGLITVAEGHEEAMIDLGYEMTPRARYTRCFLARYRRADRPAEEGAAPAHTTQPSPVRGPAAEEKDR